MLTSALTLIYLYIQMESNLCYFVYEREEAFDNHSNFFTPPLSIWVFVQQGTNSPFFLFSQNHLTL